MTSQNTTTSTQSTAPSNPDVNPTVSTLLQGVQKAYGEGPKPFNESTYAGVGPTTRQSWTDATSAANNQGFKSGITGGINELGQIASGQRFGMADPGYASLRSGLINDVTTNNLSAFNNSGLFGSDSNQRGLSEGLGTALGQLDYGNFLNDQQRQMSAIQALPDAYQSSLLPSQTLGAVGAAQDQDAQGQLQGRYDLFNRQTNGTWDNLAKASSILGGTAPYGGTTSTTTEPAPSLLQQLLGGAAIGSGIYKNIWGT